MRTYNAKPAEAQATREWWVVDAEGQPLGRVASKGRASRAATPIPLGRQGTAWEVAYATAFLLSDESSYITGQSLVIDGGLSNLR